MRRCELAGTRRDLLDLDAGTLTIEVTRVVVDGRVIESDGKTENAQHVLALDPFTLAVLKAHVEQLDQERRDFGQDYHDHGVLFCWPDGRPPHPNTITRRFKEARSGGRTARDRPARRAAQLRHCGPRCRDRLEGTEPIASDIRMSRSP
jgi:integrase